MKLSNFNKYRIEKIFDDANSCQQHGKFEEAIDLYKNILKIDPNLYLVWDRLGYLYLSQGLYEESTAALKKAYDINPDSFTALFNLVLTLNKSGQAKVAQIYSDKLVSHYSKDIDVLTLAGEIALNLADYKKAESLFRVVTERAPKVIKSYQNWSSALKGLGYYEQSVEVCDVALIYEPNNAMVHFSRALSLKQLDRLHEAIEAYQNVMHLLPEYSPAYNNTGNIYAKLGEFKQAIKYYEKCISINSMDFDALGNMADAYFHLKNYTKCIECYNISFSVGGGGVKQYINYANVLQAVHRWDEALLFYDKAIALESTNAEAWCNKGNTLKGLRQWDLARDCFMRAQSNNPDFAQAYWNQSLLELTIGNFEIGFSLYEWRWKNPELGLHQRQYSQPLWLGEDIRGMHLFVWDEQGLGDKIQMMRYARFLSENGVKVTIEVPNALFRIAKTLSPLVSVIENGAVPVNFDYHCPYMSLPLAFNTNIQSIPSYPFYLSATDDAKDFWRKRIYGKNNAEKKLVGLVWSGSIDHTNDHMRSISLEKMIAMLDKESASYWSLQREYRKSDYDILTSSVGNFINDSSSYLNDFSDTAGLISQMEYVISVDTSVAHLAAAMGVPVILLLPKDPDFRWLHDRIDSPWYGSIKIQFIE
jgi:tetratricopeptide (TPR) repeat protein